MWARWDTSRSKCEYIHALACTCASMHIHMCVHAVCAHVQECKIICVHMCLDAHVCVCTIVWWEQILIIAYVHVCKYSCMHMYFRTFAYVHMCLLVHFSMGARVHVCNIVWIYNWVCKCVHIACADMCMSAQLFVHMSVSTIVCVHGCVHNCCVHVSAYTCACVQKFMHAQFFEHVLVDICMCAYWCTYVHECACTSLHTCLCTCVFVHMCLCAQLLCAHVVACTCAQILMHAHVLAGNCTCAYWCTCA